MITILLNFIIPILMAYQCPSNIESNPSAQKAHQWLTHFSGRTHLHGCVVEITACDPHSNSGLGSPIGEVYIQLPDGRYSYLSIVFPTDTHSKFKTKTEFHKRSFSFQKTDRFYEEEHGRTEVWRLELQTQWDNLDLLESITLGVYTTNSALNQWNGNDSHWYVCQPESHRVGFVRSFFRRLTQQ